MTEPDADSTINYADRAERERIMLRKMFRTVQSTEGVYIHDDACDAEGTRPRFTRTVAVSAGRI